MGYQVALPESCMAAVVAELGRPVELRELPMPELEHGALLVKIEAATGAALTFTSGMVHSAPGASAR